MNRKYAFFVHFDSMPMFATLQNRMLNLSRPFKGESLRLVLFLLICLVNLYKLGLVGEGFLSFPDESRYTRSGKALKDVSEGNLQGALNEIFSTQGRPADALVKTIPNFFQFITSRLQGTGTFESANAYPLFLFNFLLAGFFLLVFYRLSRLLLKDEIPALLAVLFFSLLNNSYVYLRHALPYDGSLLLLYYVIYRIIFRTLADSMNPASALRFGFLSFFGYLMYPGYFPLFLIGGFLIIFLKFNSAQWKRRFVLACFFSLGTLLCLALFEMVSRSIGNSYLESARKLSGTVTQGSFEESFVFIIKYLWEVEGVSGTMIMAGFTGAVILMIRSIFSAASDRNDALLLTLFAFAGLYLCYAGMGFFMHKVVYYGRLIHQYLPVMCLFAALAFYRLSGLLPLKRWILPLVLVPMAFQFLHNISVYKSFAYPRDVFWDAIYQHHTTAIQTREEYGFAMSLLPVHSELQKAAVKPDSGAARITVVNGAYFFPLRDSSAFAAFLPPAGAKLLFSKPHFSGFKAYRYEGYDITERANLERFQFQIKVFAEP